MGSRIRLVEPDIVYEITWRTVDRTFLFTPNHRADAPLLAHTCGPDALNPLIDVIPDPSIINIIGASIGRALEKHPVQVHAFESSSDYLHGELSVTEDQMGNLAPFVQHVLSLIARETNRAWQREGHVFGGRARMHACVDDESAEQKLLYAITNAAKDNLIETTRRSPFFSTYKHQAEGDALDFWFLDYQAYWTAGGPRNKKHRLKDYIKWVDWQTTPLPSRQDKTESQRQTWIRKQVKALEEGYAEERRKSAKTVIGIKRLIETDPRDRPKTPKKSGRAPLCHAATKEAANEYNERWKNFRDAFIQASADYRGGMWEREFPEGSYRPPLTAVVARGSPV